MIVRPCAAASAAPLVAFLACAAPASPPVREACAVDTAAASIAAANDQRTPAGRLIGDTLFALLDVRSAMLVPEDADGPHLPGAAFAEAGAGPTVPGPLLRAPAGTTILADVCNTLADTVWLTGLATAQDTLALEPGAAVVARIEREAPGFRAYRAMTRTIAGDAFRPAGPSGQLAGAIVLDGERPWGDRVLVITDWAPDPAEDPDEQRFALLVNGRSWPHTERLHYAVGDTARWIVVNASPVEHPMHLHGFHFAVLARSSADGDSVYSPERVREAVTETLLPSQSMALEWIPVRGGRWLFHCHIASHMSGAQAFAMQAMEPPAAMPHFASAEEHARTAMGGLVVGIEVEGDPAAGLAAGRPARNERILIQQRPAVWGGEPGYGFVRQRDAEPASDSIVIPGEPLVLRRGEPTEVVVVNRLDVPTSVHWHGLEIESYFDGVPGWTGDAQRRSPLLAPGDSLVVRLAPPRTGTYIYHAHADEQRQLGAGLFGAVLVLEPGETRDPATDHVLLFSMAGVDLDTAPIVANNGATPALTLAAGRENRIRLINISAEDVVGLQLLSGEDSLSWRVVAHDGAELPAPLARPVPARLFFGPGETADVLITPAAGDLRLVAVTAFNDFEAILRAR